MTYQDRIAALRNALATISRRDCWNSTETARFALNADDYAAAEPPPDLPLAEGSEWAVADGGGLAIWDELGNEITLEDDGNGVCAVCSYRRGDMTDAVPPDLRNVLALARRKGLV